MQAVEAFAIVRVDVGEVADVEGILDCVLKNFVVLTDATFELRLEVVAVISVAVVTMPHTLDPVDIVRDEFLVRQRTVALIRLPKATLALQAKLHLASL